jgi:hypothetical protein
MQVQDLESYGKVGGFLIIVFSSVSAFVWKSRQQGEKINDLEAAVFPDDPAKKLLSLGWHDRIQADCERQRAKDMEILAGHIVEKISKELGPIKEDLSVLKALRGGGK